jgi:UDP-N-acetylmuramoyl-tripeptide--D-alanyl-D-alanine ligase
MLLKGPYTITMDAYNANPTSMSAALTHFGQQNNNQKRCVILGDMFELGTSASEEHQAIVTQLKTLSIDTIYLVGTLFSGTDHHDDRFRVFATYADLEATLIKAPVTEPFILVKGSRAMALERLLERAL